MTSENKPTVLESYFENRVQFSEPIFGSWGSLENPLAGKLYFSLRKWGVTLEDISWNQQTKNLNELQLTVTVPKMDVLIHVGLAGATFISMNPDWSREVDLGELFETAKETILQESSQALEDQEFVLAMHIAIPGKGLREKMARLVNTQILGSARMFGISLYDEGRSLIIDRSAKYPDALFVRLDRKIEGDKTFSELAKVVYHDEWSALGLLGIQDLMTG